MSADKTHAEKTSAEKTSIGFDYQYYFFLLKVLSLVEGQSVGLEVKDDVHSELNNDTQILYQLKHTTKKKKGNLPVNITSLDNDLWKTISNWIQVIQDKADNRGTKQRQINFINKTHFILATNKCKSTDNKLINAVHDLQNEKIVISEFKNSINQLCEYTKNEVIIGYINRLLALDESVLKAFINKLIFELNENELIHKCKMAIKADKVPENKIDEVFSSLDSAIREDNFIEIKNGNKIQISFDAFFQKYRKYYDIARSCPLYVRQLTEPLPSKMEDQVFIQQILEIEDIQADDLESIAEFTTQRLKLANNIECWLQKGELTVEEVKQYRENAVIVWKNEHRKRMRKPTQLAEQNTRALEVLDAIRDKTLVVSESNLPVELSNGAFYELSDVPDIGWRKDWEKYKQ